MNYLYVFLMGGAICLVGQILLSKTNLTPARILVIFVTSGVFLTAVGLYEPLVKFGRAGAEVPLTGFGYALAKGAFDAVDEHGLLGALSGGVEATATGIAAAIVFGYLVALIFKPKTKK